MGLRFGFSGVVAWWLSWVGREATREGRGPWGGNSLIAEVEGAGADSEMLPPWIYVQQGQISAS